MSVDISFECVVLLATVEHFLECRGEPMCSHFFAERGDVSNSKVRAAMRRLEKLSFVRIVDEDDPSHIMAAPDTRLLGFLLDVARRGGQYEKALVALASSAFPAKGKAAKKTAKKAAKLRLVKGGGK